MKYNAKYDRWVSKDGLVYRYDKKNDKLVLCAEYITPDKGYVIISLSKPKHTPYKLHRIVWETFNGEIPDGYEIDHIDGNKQNNVLSNLRCVTHIENMANPITKERFRLSQIGNSKARGKIRSDFGDRFKSKYGITCTDNKKLYARELAYYRRHKVCSWEVEECKS